MFKSRVVPAAIVCVGMTLTACAPSHGPPPSSPETRQAWAAVDRELATFTPDVGMLVARVAPGGTCHPVHEVASSTARPTASQFKLFVLGALANQIRDGRVSWDQTLTIQDSIKSLGNGPGSLQTMPAGTKVSVEEVATKMIQISDNTAADMLIGLVGRDNVEAQVRQWSANASADEPFLTTREMFLLHYVAGLGDQYLATPQRERAAFLASSVDPLPLTAIASGLTPNPRYIDQIEWFAAPSAICRAFSGLHRLSRDSSLAPLSTIPTHELGTIGLDPSRWPKVWFKGGSEPGVLTLGWLATNRSGQSYVVEALASNPDEVLAADSITDLVALAREAFAILD